MGIKVIKELKRDYILKGIGQPEYYLGGNVIELDDVWNKAGIYFALSAKTYIENVVKKFKTLMRCDFRKHKSPIDANYHPEKDTSPTFNAQDHSIYHALIGLANWMITLG